LGLVVARAGFEPT